MHACEGRRGDRWRTASLTLALAAAACPQPKPSECAEGSFFCLGECLPLGSRCGAPVAGADAALVPEPDAGAGLDAATSAGADAGATAGPDAGTAAADSGLDCASHWRTECSLGKVWWVDSCGRQETVALECPQGCVDGACKVALGSRCDPNFFAEYCDGAVVVRCPRGVVTGDAPCPADTSCGVVCRAQPCELVDLEGACVPAGEACDPGADFERCASRDVQRCDVAAGRWVTQPCPAGKECKQAPEGWAFCLDPGAEPCQDKVSWCVDSGHLRQCVNDQVTVTACEGSRPRCFSVTPPPDSRASFALCGPSDGVPCEGESFVAECLGTVARNCVGWVYEEACAAGTECRLSVLGPRVASCAQPGAVACDVQTYRPWCDGNQVATCGPGGWTHRRTCASWVCEVDLFGAECRDPNG